MIIKGLLEILKITAVIILFITMPLVIFTIITSKFPLFGIQSFVVLTGSMEPAIPVGSIVLTKVTENYKVGDIIAFKSGDITITHRVTEIINDTGQIKYRTWGDANNTPDSSLVASEDILGRSIFRAMNAGKLVLYLKTMPGFLLLIVLPTLLFIGSEIRNIKQEFEREVEKKLMRRFGQL